MFLQWFSVTMVYYGLLFASTSLSGDPYVNFTLVVLAELPCMFIYLRYGNQRKENAILINEPNIMITLGYLMFMEEEIP